MNCLKTMTFLTTALLSTAAFASQGVYGTWKMPDVNQGPFSMVATITVAQNLVTSAATCTMNGQSASVTASAPATITPTQIQVTGSGHQDATGAVSCNVDIQPGNLDYVVSPDDNTLTLTVSGQSISFTRQQP